MPESTGLAERRATPAWGVSANDIAATGSYHEVIRTPHVHITVQTCEDLRTIRPLVEGQPSTELP